MQLLWDCAFCICVMQSEQGEVKKWRIIPVGCHGPADVPRLATRCLCVLSTWLVVCLVPCAPMSIVCPLPSCYLIIVSVAPAVSPSLPSFVSLYSSPCVCSPVLIRCLSCVHVMWVKCLTVLQSSACLLVFPLRGGFCYFVLFCY